MVSGAPYLRTYYTFLGLVPTSVLRESIFLGSLEGETSDTPTNSHLRLSTSDGSTHRSREGSVTRRWRSGLPTPCCLSARTGSVPGTFHTGRSTVDTRERAAPTDVSTVNAPFIPCRLHLYSYYDADPT